MLTDIQMEEIEARNANDADYSFGAERITITKLIQDIKVLKRALFISCRWTIHGKPQSAESCSHGMEHFIEKAEKELA